jgi:hypothetical protein
MAKIQIFDKFFIILACVFVLATFIILWATGTINICGDGYCTSKECNSGCKDCDRTKCIDGICQPQVGENCRNTNDCFCEVQQVCEPGRTGSDINGCYTTVCGDSFCDSKNENINNCCIDCGCNVGYTCNTEKNECQFLTPKLEVTTNYVGRDISASTIYSNRELIDDNGEKHALASFRITNKGSNIAKKIKLSVSIGDYTEQHVEDLGELQVNEYVDFYWFPTAKESILDIRDDMSTQISIGWTFEDEHGKVYSSGKSIPLILLGRGKWGILSSVSQFVTPIDPVVRQAVSAAGSFAIIGSDGIDDVQVDKAARAIWDLLGGLNIQYISDPKLDYRLYPAEVLKTKRGDCDDLATLYATLLESISVKTALILHPSHMYAAFYDSKYIYPIETTMIGSSFEDALKVGLENFNKYKEEKQITDVETEWEKKNIKTPSYVGVGSSELSFPNIDVRSSYNYEWVCTSYDQWGNCLQSNLNLYCDVTFSNSGNAKGQKCVNVYVYYNDYSVKNEVECAEVDPGDTSDSRVTYIYQNAPNEAFSYGCRVQ